MSNLIPKRPNRRAVLRGALGGGAITLGLPYLDCVLNDNGTALAAGTPLPVRFGTWFWGLGHTPEHAVTDKTVSSPGVDFKDECQALVPHSASINYFGKFNAPLDGRSNYPHISGWVASRTGTAPSTGDDVPEATYDLLIADVIGTRNRFKTIDLSCTGNPRDSYTARSTYSRSAAEVSPVEFYKRLFGPEFVDPNKAEFKPDPSIMVRQSVLSAVTEERKKLVGQVGASDRAQLDEYFTSIRELENQLHVQLQKPAPNEACIVLPPPSGGSALEQNVSGVEIEKVEATHKSLAKILAMAVACNQTSVFNMVFSASLSELRKPGENINHHSLSHEEQIDAEFGYQPQTSWFNARSMAALASFIEIVSSIREGDGTLLDNMLVLAGSETSFAKTHSVDDIPFMTLGKAGGRIKTGLHIVGNGDPITRVGLTAMRVMGVPIERWGTKSLQTSKVISDIIA